MNKKALLDKERKNTAKRTKTTVKYERQTIQIGPLSSYTSLQLTATEVPNFKLKTVEAYGGGGLWENLHKVSFKCENDKVDT